MRHMPVMYVNWLVKHSDPYNDFMDDIYELKQRFQDLALTKKAAKMGIFLDEFPYPIDPENPEDKPYTHWHKGHFEYVLHDESRVTLRKAIREYEPIYIKNRRDTVEFWTKWIPALTGLLGAAIGVIAALKK